MKNILILLLLVPFGIQAQVNIDKYNPRVVDPPARKLIEYSWPHYYNVPSYVGVVGGYQGFKSSYYTMGLAFNFMKMDQIGIGGMAGGQLLHKRHFREDLQTFEGEIGVYSIICLGLNANYNVSGDESTFGVRPFIGLSLYNFQFSWGYNFYSKLNQIDAMRHSNWEVKYVLPLFRLNRKEKRYYTPYRSSYRHYPSYGPTYPQEFIGADF